MGQLNELQIKAAQPRDKEYMLSDGEGLYLRVSPNGKVWLYRYSQAREQAKLSLGSYPAVTLAMARRKARDEAEKRAGGIDPRDARREQQERDRVACLNTFELTARAWHAQAQKDRQWSANYAEKVMRHLELHVFPLGSAKIPNLKTLMKGAGSDMFAGVCFGAVGIVYRPDLVPGGKITSWNDLWKPEFKNKVSLPVPTIFPGKMIIIASLLNGGTVTNPDPGIEFLGKIKSNVIFHNADAQARRALAQGELWAVVTTPSAVGALRDQKIPVAMVSPKPTPLFFEGMMMVRSGKEDMAATFINKVLSPEWQRYITETYNMGPTRQDVPPSASFKEVVPKESDAVIVDEEFMNLNIGSWTEKFNAMAGK